jgi:hypothetical protein
MAESGPSPTGMPERRAILVATLIVVLWVVQLALGYIESLGLGPLSGGLFAIGVVSFYAWHTAGAGMKATITATFATVYLALLAAFVTSDRTRQQIDDATGANVWEGFTWLVGVVVVSYFGASTAGDVLAGRKAAASETEPSEPTS